jgi:ribosomal protein L7/L12
MSDKVVMVRIPLADLRVILDRELSAGVFDSDDVARHRRLTVALVKGEEKAIRDGNYTPTIVGTFVDYGSNKIAVIKAHRAHYGAGLKESKYWSEGDFSQYPAALDDLAFARELEDAGASISWAPGVPARW